MRLFSALSHRPFALLWAGRTISSLGDGVYLVALAWWVIATTGSAAANGIILICAIVPTLLLSLVGGVAVDRLPRRALLWLSDGMRGVVVGVVAFLAWRHQLTFWHLAALSVVFGTVRAFFAPAYASILPRITPREMLPSANALARLSGEATGILGPAHLGVVYYYVPQGTNCTVATCQLDVGFVSSTNGGGTWSAPAQLAGPMNEAWLANTNQGYMAGDYFSASFSGGKCYPVFSVATGAPSAGVYSQAAYTWAGGLTITGGTRSGAGSRVYGAPAHPAVTGQRRTAN